MPTPSKDNGITIPKYFIAIMGSVAPMVVCWCSYLTLSVQELQISQARQDAQLEDTAELKEAMKELRKDLSRVTSMIERVDAKLEK
jgi:hypothetical protein